MTGIADEDVIMLQLCEEDFEKVKAWLSDKRSYIKVEAHTTKSEIGLFRYRYS